MNLEKKIKLISSVGEEIITLQELRELLSTKKRPVAYDGFEPSGLAHLPFGVYRAINIKKMISAGIHFKLYVADYFAFINEKFNGDMKRIRACGKYFVEVWRASGIKKRNVEIVWASQLMDSLKYWDLFLRVSRNVSLNRAKRAITIAGRKESDVLTIAQLYYPQMQVTDIFMLNADICQLGMDQRRANMLAREVASKIGKRKPVAVHHHMLYGLQGGNMNNDFEAKMSKSKPETSIYVHDNFKEIKQKISSAYCPKKSRENNPVLDYFKHIIFELNKKIEIERPARFGGNIEFDNYQDLEKNYLQGKIHPLDLKNACAEYIEKAVQPIRKHFETNNKAKELYEIVAGK